MSDIITKPGFYRQRNGDQYEVVYGRDGRWYGHHVESGVARSHKPCGRMAVLNFDTPYDITGPWQDPPAFSVGDTVLVNASGPRNQHYGTIVNLTGHALKYVVQFSDGTLAFSETELTRVTLPAPLPDGCRLLPRNARPPKSTGRGVNNLGRWAAVFKWAEMTAEEWDREFPDSAPHFFAEPIPAEPLPEPEKWTPTCELRLRPDPKRCAGKCRLMTTTGAMRLEQRFTCGDREKWRAVGVKQ